MLASYCMVQAQGSQSEENRKASQGERRAYTSGCVAKLPSGSKQVSVVAQFHKTVSRRQYEIIASCNSLGEGR